LAHRFFLPKKILDIQATQWLNKSLLGFKYPDCHKAFFLRSIERALRSLMSEFSMENKE